jgi:hypothetical protein
VLEEERHRDVQQLGSHQKAQSDDNSLFDLRIICKEKRKKG